jgi:hypothetical protein
MIAGIIVVHCIGLVAVLAVLVSMARWDADKVPAGKTFQRSIGAFFFTGLWYLVHRIWARGFLLIGVAVGVSYLCSAFDQAIIGDAKAYPWDSTVTVIRTIITLGNLGIGLAIAIYALQYGERDRFLQHGPGAVVGTGGLITAIPRPAPVPRPDLARHPIPEEVATRSAAGVDGSLLARYEATTTADIQDLLEEHAEDYTKEGRASAITILARRGEPLDFDRMIRRLRGAGVDVDDYVEHEKYLPSASHQGGTDVRDERK